MDSMGHRNTDSKSDNRSLKSYIRDSGFNTHIAYHTPDGRWSRLRMLVN